jgi:hypothetical protein
MQNFDKFYALQCDQLAAVLAVPDLVIMSPAASVDITVRSGKLNAVLLITYVNSHPRLSTPVLLPVTALVCWSGSGNWLGWLFPP